MSEEQEFNDVKKISRLLAIYVTKEMSFDDKLTTLKRAGFTNQEISEITGSAPATVRSQFLKIRKKTNGKNKTKSKTEN